MRLVLAQGLDVGDAQFFAGNAELAQAEIFRQGVVFAIGGALDQGLDGRGPVIGLTPDAGVVLKSQLLVEEAIDRSSLLALGQVAFTLQHLAPGLDSSLGRPEAGSSVFRRFAESARNPRRARRCQARPGENWPAAAIRQTEVGVLAILDYPDCAA